MNKIIGLLVMVLFAASLAACSTAKKAEVQRVRCPACGYEFAMLPPNTRVCGSFSWVPQKATTVFRPSGNGIL